MVELVRVVAGFVLPRLGIAVFCWGQGIGVGLSLRGKHGFTALRAVLSVNSTVFVAIVIRTIFMPIRQPVFMARHPGRGPGQARVIRTVLPISRPVFMAIVVRTVLPISQPVFMAIVIRTFGVPIRQPVFMAIVIRTFEVPIRKPVFMAIVIRTVWVPIRKPVFMAIVIRIV